MDNFEQILKNEFLDEAAQSLADTEQCFLLLENDPENSDNLNKIFRLAHNLKGSSKAVGFFDMSAFTHEFESLILKLKNKELEFNPQIINLLLTCNDHLIKMVDLLKQDSSAALDSSDLLQKMVELKNPPVEDVSNFEAEAASVSENFIQDPQVNEATEVFSVEPALNETQVSSQIEIEPNLDLLNELLGLLPEEIKLAPVATTSTPSEKIEKIELCIQPKQEVSHLPKETASSKIETQNKNQGPEESIRISVNKLESLLNFVGEMVILQSVLKEQALSTNSILLRKTVHQLQKVGKEIQDISMSLRMIPIKPTFQKMQRIVRDTALSLKKDVTIQMIGEDTELDKTVLEKINDPLVHLIRNSVDHGIETIENRVAKGKTEKGLVTLSAMQRSGKLIIEVKDDGAGLNPEKLKKKAIEKGLIRADAQLSDKEAYNLIFAPGFSTKELVTDVSGRGVGMDVVKTNIHDLSGEIQIFSELEKGTTFQITLPLSLAIIDGMVVSFGNEKFVIPLNQVHETLRPSKEHIQFNQGMGNTLMLRGENLSLYRLGDFFNQQSRLESTHMIALVIRTGPKPYALLVDDILGHYQVVIKKLGPELSNLKGVSGSTILGDGKPTLIIEPNELLKRAKNLLGPKLQIEAGGKAA